VLTPLSRVRKKSKRGEKRIITLRGKEGRKIMITGGAEGKKRKGLSSASSLAPMRKGSSPAARERKKGKIKDLTFSKRGPGGRFLFLRHRR